MTKVNYLRIWIKKIKAFSKSYSYKFLLMGILNSILNRLIVFILLYVLPTSFASLGGNIIHSFLGYITSSRIVFLNKGKKNKYILLVLSLWILDCLILNFLLFEGFGKIFSLILISIFLGFISFIIQKFMVFD